MATGPERRSILLIVTCLMAVASIASAQSGPVTDTLASQAVASLNEQTVHLSPFAPRLAGQPSAPVPKGRDSVWNGVLIGAGVGALLGLIPDHVDDCEECHDSLYWSIAVGAGAGLAIDLFRSTKPGATPSKPDDGLPVSVAAGRGRAGVRGVFRWR